MTAPTGGWVAVRAGHRQVILGLDYGLTRPESTLDELVDILGFPASLWVPDYREWIGTEAGPPARAQALVDRWATALIESNVDVFAVFGYCAGATFAQTLSQALAAGGGPLAPVLLFDPQVVTAEIVYDCFAQAVQTASVRDPSGTRKALHNGLAAIQNPAAARDLLALAETLTDEYAAVLHTACVNRGLPEVMERELKQRLQAYLRYLALAAEFPADAQGEAVAFVSSDFPSPNVFGPQRSIDVCHADLLRSARTARSVRNELGIDSEVIQILKG